MISVDIERFKNRILEYGKNDYRQMSEEQAKYFANRLSQKLDACMQDDVISFINGGEPSFKFKGVSIQDINKKEKCGVVLAYMTMNLLVHSKTVTPRQYMKLDLRPIELR